jgi:hypothetical protein
LTEDIEGRLALSKTVARLALVSLTAVSLMVGCGGDDGGPDPVSGVDISAEKAELEIGHPTTISAKVSGGDSKTLDWFVIGIPNGNPQVGTIAQNSPATYVAPDSVPDPSRVIYRGGIPGGLNQD